MTWLIDLRKIEAANQNFVVISTNENVMYVPRNTYSYMLLLGIDHELKLQYVVVMDMLKPHFIYVPWLVVDKLSLYDVSIILTLPSIHRDLGSSLTHGTP